MIQKSYLVGDDVFTISGFLSKEECQELIEFSESEGFEFATLGNENVPTLRNNARVTVDDPQRAAWIWERLNPFLPKLDHSRMPTGLNSRIRFYRYDKEQQFEWHSDGFVSNDKGHTSAYTFLIYLSDGFQGGETSFHDSRSGDPNRFQVTPKAGLALCFLHEILHRSEPMEQGRKYVLRTDVMYERNDE